MRVVIQIEQRLYREGLTLLLEREPDVAVVGAAGTADEAVSLCAAVVPDVLVVDAESDEVAARRAAMVVRRRHTRVRVVGMGRSTLPGFHQVVDRDEGVRGLLAAVRSARPAAMGPPASLSPRELTVLGLIGSGLTTRAMAAELAISPKTVENHKQRMFAKLGVQNQAHAVAVGIRAGLLPAGAWN